MVGGCVRGERSGADTLDRRSSDYLDLRSSTWVRGSPKFYAYMVTPYRRPPPSKSDPAGSLLRLVLNKGGD